jgi:hypothetical protein
VKRLWFLCRTDTDFPAYQYGTIRVYEWGPEDGKKVLFIHGISTSCMTVSVLAEALVERGCRVMIFVRPPSFDTLGSESVAERVQRTKKSHLTLLCWDRTFSAVASQTAWAIFLTTLASTSPRFSLSSPRRRFPGPAPVRFVSWAIPWAEA